MSARDLADQAAPRGARRHIEPAGDDLTVTGASLVQWTSAHASFEVAQANPGLCAVLENAALRFAGGQAAEARQLLEEGIASRDQLDAVEARCRSVIDESVRFAEESPWPEDSSVWEDIYV